MLRPQRVSFAKAFSSIAAAVLLTAISGCQMMSSHAANNLGTGYFREGNYTAARRSFQQAVIEMPENPDFRYNLAATMQKQGDFAGAEQVYRQTLHLDPAHQPSYHGLAQLLNSQGRPAEAQQLISSWVATQPYTPASHIEMAWLQQKQGNQFAAAQSLQTALKIQPNHPVALAQLGQVYQESGQPELAVAYYQRSLQGNWRQPEVQKRLAALLPKNAPRRPAQIAFGMPNGRNSPPPASTQTAWRTPTYAMPAAAPAMRAALPLGMTAQPAHPMMAHQTMMPQNFSPMPPAMPPQSQTAGLPPQMASQSMPQPAPVVYSAQAMPQPAPAAMSHTRPQPTPVQWTQPYDGGQFPPQVPNADPAHVPQATAELPVVRPY